MTEHRLSWDEVWNSIAITVSLRTLCSAAHVGAVIVDRQNRIVSTGYNGPPAGFNHGESSCIYWCPRQNGAFNGILRDSGVCVAVHAEANALLSGDRSTWQGGTMYVTKHPCLECAKLIANSGLERLVVRPEEAAGSLFTPDTYEFLEACGVTVEVDE